MSGDGAVGKAMAILTFLAEQDGKGGVREMAQELNLAKSTVHRLLQGLKSDGFVHFDPETRRYTLGVELYRFASLVLQRVNSLDMARSVMEEAVRECNETLLLGIYNPAHRKMMFAVKVDCDHPVRYVIEVGSLLPVHQAASGKGILAWLPDEEVDMVVEQLQQEGQQVDRAALKEELHSIRQRGYAISRSQRISGAVGIAAPVFRVGGALLGDLVLTIPEFRYRDDMEQPLALFLMEKAVKLSRLLGFHPEEAEQKLGSEGGYR